MQRGNMRNSFDQDQLTEMRKVNNNSVLIKRPDDFMAHKEDSKRESMSPKSSAKILNKTDVQKELNRTSYQKFKPLNK